LWQNENAIFAQPHIGHQVVCSTRFWMYMCWD